MAHLSTVYCSACGKDTSHCNMECSECSCRKRREEEARWASLTDREQVQELLKRIEAIERRDIMYK